jgi:hypothetical protein
VIPLFLVEPDSITEQGEKDTIFKKKPQQIQLRKICIQQREYKTHIPPSKAINNRPTQIGPQSIDTRFPHPNKIITTDQNSSSLIILILPPTPKILLLL